jgi:hypothetical protein
VAATPDPFAEANQVEGLQRALVHAQRQLARAKDRSERLVEATIAACKDAVVAQGRILPVKPPTKDRRTKGTEVALWHLSDWQGSKLTASYNSEVMAERVGEFVKVARIITDMRRSASPCPEVVICFGGDMVEGLFNFPTQPFEIDATIFGQYVSVARLIVDTVRSALSIYDKVTVVAEWGNHGRIGSKRSAVPRSDNFDRMCYELARQLLAAEPRLDWRDCPEDIQRVEIGRYRALLIHGDEVGRNGFASPTTIVQWVTRQKSGAYPWPFRDAYIGHYHTHASWALPDGFGSVYQTGSTESDNRYAGVTMASSAQPSQRLHFIDPDRGRVIAEHKIWLS